MTAATHRRVRKGRRRIPSGQMFGLELSKMMLGRKIGQTRLCEMLRARGRKMVQQNVSYFVQGHRLPTPEIVDDICAALGLGDDQRAILHWSAAVDYGFRVPRP